MCSLFSLKCSHLDKSYFINLCFFLCHICLWQELEFLPLSFITVLIKAKKTSSLAFILGAWMSCSLNKFLWFITVEKHTHLFHCFRCVFLSFCNWIKTIKYFLDCFTNSFFPFKMFQSLRRIPWQGNSMMWESHDVGISWRGNPMMIIPVADQVTCQSHWRFVTKQSAFKVLSESQESGENMIKIWQTSTLLQMKMLVWCILVSDFWPFFVMGNTMAVMHFNASTVNTFPWKVSQFHCFPKTYFLICQSLTVFLPTLLRLDIVQ